MRQFFFWLCMAFHGAALASTTQWTGFYSCAQGATALKLTLIDDDPARLTAVFAFGPTPANPDIPRGSFTMQGAGRGGALALAPVAWLEQPPDYEMVRLRGNVVGSRFEGRIEHETCAAFSLQRQPG